MEYPALPSTVDCGGVVEFILTLLGCLLPTNAIAVADELRPEDGASFEGMEAKYGEIERNKLRHRLEVMANVHTAEKFGLDNLPSDVYEQMAAALEDDDWEAIEQMQWFKDAQQWATDDDYFHWKLEYPEAFYDEDGSEVPDSGFDAVIGNPPYIRSKNLPDHIKDYLKSVYNSTTGRWDIYCLFTEKGISICSGRLSYIQPMMFLRRPYGEGLRKMISETSDIGEIVDLSDFQVFGDATNYVCIFTLNCVDGDDEFPVYTPTEEEQENFDKNSMSSYLLKNTELGGNPWDVIPAPVAKILRSTPEDFVTLDVVTESISEGIHSGKDEVFFVSSEVIKNYALEDDLLKPVLKGRDIKEYLPPSTELKVIYPYSDDEVIKEDQLKSKYPNIWEYLKENEEKLRSRQYVLDSGKEWYELWCERKEEIYQNPKILLPEISSGNNFTADTSGVNNYFNTKVKSIRTTDGYSLEALLGLLNSDLLEFVYRGIAPPKRGGFRAYKTGFLNELLVPAGTPPELDGLVKDILNRKQKRDALNLAIMDYIEPYSDGDSLGEFLEYQPPSGISDSPLTYTSKDLDSLRFGSILVEKSADKVIIQASARYKPTNEDEYETDQWGYTETELTPALEFVGLDEETEALVSEFVPHAVEEAGGFANYRETATKTNSLVDRLESLTLPDLNTCREEFERYLQKRESVVHKAG